MRTKFYANCAPKEVWLVLPMLAVDFSWRKFTIVVGWLCFAACLEIMEEDE